MESRHLYSQLNNQRGVTAVIVAICLIMLVGFIALSVDVSHILVARNELQNAADAGALSGAGNLYLDDGTAINTNANQFGYDAAVANYSDQMPVEVNWTSGNTGDVQRGHWSFGLGSLARGFYPNASTATVDLWGVTTEELDENPNFINAVRVISRRQAAPVSSFFARIFGYEGFVQTTEAVAYIGFAGTLQPAVANAPIAICEQSILKTNEDGTKQYECNEGRFINDAAGGQDEETGMWTSFDQGLDEEGNPLSGGDPCSGGTNAAEVRPLVDCTAILGGGGVNPHTLILDRNMAVNNGQISSVFNDFYSCWETHYKDDYMPLVLPVINCQGDPTTCAPLVGAVEVYIVHMTQNPNYRDLPVTKQNAPPGEFNPPMGPWNQNNAVVNDCDGQENPDKCVWDNFANHFGLVGADLNPETGNYTAAYQANTIYFLKSCRDHIPQGVSGGENFGILAEIPVLVK